MARQPVRRRQPVFVKHPPVIHHPPEAWHHHVPYPYRFKWDGGWIFIILLAAAGFAIWKPLLVLAGFIAVLRAWVWLAFRFPLTTYFLTQVVYGLFGIGCGRGGRYGRW